MSDTDDPALSGDLDALGPWTIRAISGRAREAALNAARAEKITVGVWLERRIREWTEPGQALTVARTAGPRAPLALAAPESAGDLADLAQIAAVAKDLAAIEATAAKGSNSKGLSNRVAALLRVRLDGMKAVNTKPDSSPEEPASEPDPR
jgi:hypothetical protein